MDAGTGNALGAIVGGLFGMGQGAINNNQNKKAQARAYNMQRALNEQGAELAYDMWQKTNYKAQADQMKKAGLNKALMYGMGGGAGASSNTGSGGSAPQQASADYNVGGMAMQGAQQAMNLSLLKAQKENIEADTAQKKADAENKGADTTQKGEQTILTRLQQKFQDIQNNIHGNSQEEQTEEIKWRTSRAIAQFQKENAEGIIADTTRQDMINKIKAEAVGASLQNRLTEEQTKLSKEQQNQIREQIKNWATDQLQDWQGLNNEAKKIKIQKFAEELKSKYPSLMNVAGGKINEAIRDIDDIRGEGGGNYDRVE